MTEHEVNKGGRPPKLNDLFFQAAEMVIMANSGEAALIFTDEELVIAINDKLPEHAHISPSTFKDWKGGNTPESADAERFSALVKKALMLQKTYLFSALKTEDEGWQRWAWIIERKFAEWNLKRNVGLALQEDGAKKLAEKMFGTVAAVGEVAREEGAEDNAAE